MSTVADLISESLAADAAKRAAAHTAYLKLARRLAGGKMSTKDKSEIPVICADAGKELTQLQADVSILQELAQQQEQAAIIPDVNAELEQAIAAHSAHVAETARIIAERQPAEFQLLQQCQSAELRLSKAGSAQKRAAAIEAEYYELVGAPDPVQMAKRRHLAIVKRDERINSDIEVANVASIFAHRANAGLFADESIDWLPAPGQTQEQLDQLLQVCRQWIAGKIKQPAFLMLAGEDDPNLSADSKLILYATIIADQIKRTAKDNEPAYTLDVTEYVIVPLPGQDRAKLDEAVTRLADLYQRHPGTRRKKEIDNWRATQEAEMQPGAHIEMMQRGPRVWDGSGNMVAVGQK